MSRLVLGKECDLALEAVIVISQQNRHLFMNYDIVLGTNTNNNDYLSLMSLKSKSEAKESTWRLILFQIGTAIIGVKSFSNKFQSLSQSTESQVQIFY